MRGAASVVSGRRAPLSFRGALPSVPNSLGVQMSPERVPHLRRDLCQRCAACDLPNAIVGRGLCARCYVRHQRAGTLTLFGRVNGGGGGRPSRPGKFENLAPIDEAPSVGRVPRGTIVRYVGGPRALYPTFTGQMATVVGGWDGGVVLAFPSGFRGVASLDEIAERAA